MNLLNYTKLNATSYSAMKYPAGYHTICIDNKLVKGQRDPTLRLNLLPIELSNKSILDIGCNQGGMLFSLSDKIKWGVGIDYDYRMINAANKIKSIKKTHNLSFYTFDLDKEDHNLIKDFIPIKQVDIIFLLAVCKWINNWKKLVDFCSEISNLLFFETNGTEDQQQNQEEYLKKTFRNVKLLANESQDDPQQKKRKLFYCSMEKDQ